MSPGLTARYASQWPMPSWMSDSATSCLPIARVEDREISIDRGESFHTANVERISFRKFDVLRAGNFEEFSLALKP